MSFLAGTLSQFWLTVQGTLFPWLAVELGELSAKQKQLVKILELVQIERFLKGQQQGGLGRPLEDRQTIARAFVAKAVYNLETTRQLLDRLASDETLRRLCGWERPDNLPSEATFSRAFAEFSASQLPERVHAALIEKYEKPRLVGHISRDATAITAREKAAKKVKAAVVKPSRKQRAKETATSKSLTRLERQQSMTLTEMLADLPGVCDCGAKRNSKGHPSYWVGYKLHLDVADGGIPISCILTSASVNDSQVAIPLATLTAQRVDNLYDLMDSAYDVPLIRKQIIALGHVPIIDGHTRRGGEKPVFAPHEAQRYKERTTCERVFARLKEEFGARVVRVRGPAKVMTSLLFGLLALTADQLLRLIS
jgi:Transposase DDE domain/Transposase domain (DUF772)